MNGAVFLHITTIFNDNSAPVTANSCSGPHIYIFSYDDIAGYGSLVALAKQLGHGEVATLLETTLTEEKETDQKLTEVALTIANPASAEGPETRGAGRAKAGS